MNAEEFIDNKEMRNEVSNHVEILDKVKQLAMIEGTKYVNEEIIAHYYEVDAETIHKTITRNKDELQQNGYALLKRSEMEESLKGQDVLLENLGSKGARATLANGTILLIPNRGLRTFSKQCVYHIGLLLRDSEVAQAIRKVAASLLTNTSKEDQQKAFDENSLSEFDKLKIEIKELGQKYGLAIVNGDSELANDLNIKIMQNKNRQIEIKIKESEEEKLINQALSGELKIWTTDALTNALVRRYAPNMSMSYGQAWNELYYDLRYKYGISINGRKKVKGQNSKFQRLTEEEKLKAIKLMIVKMQDENIEFISILKHKEKVEK